MTIRFLFYFFFLTWSSTFLSSCAHKISSRVQSKVCKEDTTVSVTGIAEDLRITYLGCGGLLLQKDSSKILVDPFFTNPSPFVSMVTKKINPDETTIRKAFAQLNYSGVKHLLITHAHYDHLLDVPFILKEYYRDNIQVVGSATAKNILWKKEVINPKDFILADDIAATSRTMGQWIYAADSSYRILPVAYGHAPHVSISLATVKLYKGDYTEQPQKLRRAHHWKEGQNYAYLVDFLTKQKVTNRLYILSGGGASPRVGFIDSLAELDIHHIPIDVMLVCVASHNNVNDYPQQLIATHKPLYVVGVHWEDFFRKHSIASTKELKTVRLTNVPSFCTKMGAIGYEHKWHMPYPMRMSTFR